MPKCSPDRPQREMRVYSSPWEQRTVSLPGLPHLLNDCFSDVLVLVGRPIQLVGQGMELQQRKEDSVILSNIEKYDRNVGSA